MGNFRSNNKQRSRQPGEDHHHRDTPPKVTSSKVTPIRPAVEIAEKEPDEKKEVEPPPLPSKMSTCLGNCGTTIDQTNAWAKYGERGVCSSACNKDYLSKHSPGLLSDESIPWVRIFNHF